MAKIPGDKAHELDIQAFISKEELDPVALDRCYYITPDKNGEKGYVILREALLATDKIGLGKIIISTKEYIGAIGPYDNKSLLLYLIRYDEEINKVQDYDIPNKDLAAYKVNKKRNLKSQKS